VSDDAFGVPHAHRAIRQAARNQAILQAEVVGRQIVLSGTPACSNTALPGCSPDSEAATATAAATPVHTTRRLSSCCTPTG
jgi:hypothetical protein